MVMIERQALEKILAASAICILLGSGLALALSSFPHGDTSSVIVNGRSIPWDEIQANFTSVTFQANGVEYRGVRLSELVNSTSLAVPESYRYEIVSARDGYTKTVTWEDMLGGYLVLEDNKRAVFPGRKTQDWVDTVGEIRPVAE
jgi:hypothetical protein